MEKIKIGTSGLAIIKKHSLKSVDESLQRLRTDYIDQAVN